MLGDPGDESSRGRSWEERSAESPTGLQLRTGLQGCEQTPQGQGQEQGPVTELIPACAWLSCPPARVGTHLPQASGTVTSEDDLPLH